MAGHFFLSTLLFVTAILPVIVLGHGYVAEIAIDGVAYSGWLPFIDPYSTPIPKRIVRKVPSDSPILDIQNSSLACNVGGDDAAGATANANPGSTIKFTWNTWPADHKGPVDVLLASCGNSCDQMSSQQAQWFAIDKRGYNSGVWASELLIAANDSFTIQLPKNLAPGAYLMRHSILAMHSIGHPQFYPSCAQIMVGGSETGRAADSEKLSTGQLYQGVVFPNIWTMLPDTPYTIPGPKIASFIDSSTVASAPVTAPPVTSALPSSSVAVAPTSNSSSAVTAPTLTSSSAAPAPTSPSISTLPTPSRIPTTGEMKIFKPYCRVKRRATTGMSIWRRAVHSARNSKRYR